MGMYREGPWPGYLSRGVNVYPIEVFIQLHHIDITEETIETSTACVKLNGERGDRGYVT